VDLGNAVEETFSFQEDDEASAITDHFYFRYLAHLEENHTGIALYTEGEGGTNEEGPLVRFDLRSGLPHIRGGISISLTLRETLSQSTLV